MNPKNDFDPDNNKWGAWEFGLRAEKYDVDDITHTGGGTSRIRGSSSCTGGTGTGSAGAGAGAQHASASINGCESRSTTYTGGIKWILNPNAMVKFNYSRTNFGHEWEHFDLDDAKRMKKEDIVMVRTQISF